MKTILVTIAIIAAIQISYNYFCPTDSTDKSKWERSGLSVYTDQATGVQYIRAGLFGGLTPRLNKDGTLFNVK